MGKLKVLHLLAGGGIGGIESLMNDYSRISVHENYFLFLWEGGEIFDEMAKAGVHAKVWNISLKDYLLVPFKILSFTKKEQIDVIVTHHPSPLIHLINLIVHRINKNVKSCTYLHSSAEDAFHVGSRREGIVRTILRTSYLTSEKTVAISEYVADSLVRVTGIKRSKISVIYNGVDTNKFSLVGLKDNANRIDNELKIIFVGRLLKVKGVQNILQALSRTQANYRFQIVGDGNYRRELESFSVKLGISDNVDFLGTRRDIPELLTQADIFIHLPEWQEGFGITVVEAMAAGCICIVNDHGALPEIVENGVDGFVVRNNSEVRDLIDDIWKNRCEIDKSGSALYKIKQNAEVKAKQFSIEIYTRNLDGIIEGLQ